MYFVGSATQSVDVFDYDTDTGSARATGDGSSLSNARTGYPTG